MYGQRDAGFFGYSHFTGGFPGGQAEYVRVPFGNVNLLPIPDDVSDERAIYLSDVLPTSYHAVVDTGVKKGDVVGIWVGLFRGSQWDLRFICCCGLGSRSDRSMCRSMGTFEGSFPCHRYRHGALTIGICS